MLSMSLLTSQQRTNTVFDTTKRRRALISNCIQTRPTHCNTHVYSPHITSTCVSYLLLTHIHHVHFVTLDTYMIFTPVTRLALTADDVMPSLNCNARIAL